MPMQTGGIDAGRFLAQILNKECVRQGANIPEIFDAAARIVAAYCLHVARWSIDREQTPPTNAAASERAIKALDHFAGQVRTYVRHAVEHGEDPLEG